MHLADYTAGDLGLSIQLETDPEVMAELGGPRPIRDIELVHGIRVMPTPGGGMWLKIMLDDDTPIGMIGIWRSQRPPEAIWEAGWTMFTEHQGRGHGSEALALLLERARSVGRYDVLHAFPGETNGASNAVCRKHGFALVATEDLEFGGKPLRCNHWVLELTATRAVQKT